MTLIEPLDTRIAPASLIPGDKAITYTDIDGDLVRISFSKPVVPNASFAFDTPFNTDGPQQLRLIDVTEGAIAGFDIIMTVKRGPQGDGLANVGAVNVGAKDLGVVTIKGDLGRIAAGDADGTTPGVKTLNVHSMGVLGVDTQGGNPSIESQIAGPLGVLNVRTNFAAELNVNAAGEAGTGKVGKIVIGGSIVGGVQPESGRIFTNGEIGAVLVKGSVLGGGGASSGQINTGGGIKSLVIGGSIVGAAGGGVNLQTADQGSGAIIVGRVMGGTLGSVTVGGDIRGGSGPGSGSLATIGEGALGTVVIKGSVVGGGGNYSGRIESHTFLGKLSVGGSVLGGAGNYQVNEDSRGQIQVEGRSGPISVKGDVVGGAGGYSGRIHVGESLASVVIGGSLLDGTGGGSGAVNVQGDLGPAIVKRNVDGGLNVFDFSAGIQTRGNVTSITIGGYVSDGNLYAGKQLGAVTVKGDFTKSKITALGQEGATTTDVAIKSLKIGGSVRNSTIHAGFDPFLGMMNGNADAQIGPVIVGGDWLASSISAGVNAVNAFFGDGDDGLFGSDDPGIIARIASISIGGQVAGSPLVVSGSDSFAFVAQQIGAFKVNGVAFKLQADAGNDLIGLSLVTGDVRLKEFAV